MLINQIAVPFSLLGAWICFAVGFDTLGALNLAAALANAMIVWLHWKPKDE